MQHFAEMGLKPMLYGHRTYIKLLTSATFDSFTEENRKIELWHGFIKWIIIGIISHNFLCWSIIEALSFKIRIKIKNQDVVLLSLLLSLSYFLLMFPFYTPWKHQ